MTTALDIDLQTPLGRYRAMLLIRRTEEAIGELIAEGVVRGTAHLSIGQEACAVGALAAARPDDPVVSSHRGHGHFLARVLDPAPLLAELMGKAAGPCAGRGGSQHLCSVRHAFYGTNGITGGGLPVATGLALAEKLTGGARTVLCFFGDGASSQGTFHESLNMAALWDLPVLYVCENNGYAMSTRFRDTTRVPSVAARAAGCGLEARPVDGMDVEAVRETTAAALDVVRTQRRPMLIEAECYRFCGHSKSDRLLYRTRDEEAAWQRRDPLRTARARLLADGLAPEALDALERGVCTCVADARRTLAEAPAPTPEQVLTSPYASETAP
ncbi:MAG: thiamine pyrophosphate-dependent dehydrogenase E1 component subunit alpha [Candidatus Brocadiaceae bacterium]|nr:thiamine pyrophosphate-dependent dehydrogenase E1 component subunit alpha [Candidatus Brocadiaceae bacterium]